MNNKILYDICKKEDAIKTLSDITGKSLVKCKEHFEKLGNQKSEEKIKRYFALFLMDYSECLKLPITNFDYVFTHVTTSDDKCESIKKHGVVWNVEAYNNENSQLRRYLDKYEVFINEKDKSITHKGIKKIYDDSDRRYEDREINKALNQLFYDFAVCGFKTCDSTPYTCIKKCPELIKKISDYFELDMMQTWIDNSKPYVVKSKITNDKLIKGKFAENTSDLLFEAYRQANSEEQHIIVTNNFVHIMPEDIIKICPFDCW